MQCTVSTSGLRIAPRKVRLVAGLVRRQKITDALVRLQFTNKKSAKVIIKLLKSALANATHNHKVDPSRMFVHTITVNEGKVMKRRDTRAMGRSTIIRKRTSHIHLTISDTKEVSNKEKKINSNKMSEVKTDI